MNKEAYLKHKFINRQQFQTFNFNYSKIEDTLTNIISNYTEKQNINLIVNYYHDKHPDRCKEIELCLKLNCNNLLFNKIIIINIILVWNCISRSRKNKTMIEITIIIILSSSSNIFLY